MTREENQGAKNLKFQVYTAKKATVVNTSPLDTLFESVSIDSKVLYCVKKFNTRDLSVESSLRVIYDNYSVFMNFYFRNNLLPKRCIYAHKSLSDELYSKLKETNNRVSRSKVRETVKHLIKHISRLKFHNKYCIKYPRSKKHWNNKSNFNASHSYFLSLIDLLEVKGVLSNVTGYIFGSKDNEDKVSSLLIVSPDFIDWCNGGASFSKLIKMDECLLAPIVDLVEIRIKSKDKKEYKTVKPEPKDKLFYAQANHFVEKYNEAIANRVVEIDGVRIPELFFRRIFNNDMKHGARFYDRGEIQGENPTIRNTITIDGCPTIEIDYASLHYSLCAEKEGIDLSKKDPYNFDFKVDIDEKVLCEWKIKYGIKHQYDPVRNLKKVAMLAMFNANDIKSATSAISKKILDDLKAEDQSLRRFVGIKKVSVKDLVNCILEYNKEVAKYFNTGIGLHLQYLDSTMIEYCISKFLEANEVCLPVHDSLIVKTELKGFATKTMEDAYLRVMGSKINCKIK